MKTKTIKTYTFDELSDDAKEKAREWFRRSNDEDNFWSESVIEEAVREGELMGIKFKTSARKPLPGKPCIYWSGFWSQGDGACFEGTWRASDVKADKVADGWGPDPATTEIKRIAAVFAEIAKKFPCSSFKVEHSGHYQHENCTEFDFSITEDETVTDAEVVEAEDALEEVAKDFMRWIYRQLEKEYEYRNSDECVDEDICTNEYAFNEKGGRTVIL